MSKLPIPFSNPNTYKGHSGVDFPQPRGTVYRASGLGQVVSRGRNDRGGFYIWVQYVDGPLVGYHHMDSHAGCPPVRSFVREGTQLGYVGSLGQFSTGPHLHSEVSGHATTDGYWKFFDPSRVVGQPDPAGAGGSVTPIPQAAQTGADMFIYYSGVLSASNAYLAIYDGRTLKCRPTVGVEAKALIAAQPQIPRVQLAPDEVVEFSRQGGYVFQNGVGYYDGVPSYRPAK